ncbi:hypothetical protein COT77_02785 [Candidatus Berkelbacteria bacterium CG10_big_fil_rev_8_21_14_0_10_41_12]|uniref:Uncharacterized protein n=1 Tax=Candidatus Berkelbacteria bacterium CG10_big_fil_rev_8_21_14_0_10_41_12 TaxID=1974513 RepID=A0A2M6WWP0_9BACT|nr:MAG: hypothetical protein COT77_02785 [Candidatus Berkelbacteria bacterium CG10_big_fil_rev_8_21_14_0_10_41_12]
MNKSMSKPIMIGVVSFLAIVILVGALSFFVWRNQPSADIPTPPVPPPPEDVASNRPPVPPEPRLMGDATDSGYIDLLDLNAEIAYWKKYMPDFNIINRINDEGNKSIIDVLDFNSTITFWKCFEGNTKKNCIYVYQK